nr:paramyosin [Ziziphus jujuba var. spinosa]
MEDEMDSLFEGMVLFDPSNNSQFQFQSQDDSDQADDSPTPTATAPASPADALAQPQAQPQPQPLDENLFSDLTLASPLQFHTTETTPPSNSVSRQISRKKKRAAGLRIGYARDADIDAYAYSRPLDAEEPQPHTTPTPTPTVESDSTHANGHKADGAGCRLEQIKSLISDKLHRARQSVSSVSSARKDFIAARRKAAHNLHLASVAYADLENQLNDACDAEDFEAAERLSDSLAAADKDKQSLIALLRDAESHYDAVEFQMQQVLTSQIAAEEECTSLLTQFAMDASTEAHKVIMTAEVVSSKEMHRWFSSTESLEMKKMELEIESEIISEARNVLNNSIELSVENDRRERKSLCKKKIVLMDELEQLLALVKRKEEEIAQNDSDIEAVDKRIVDVVSGFQEMQSGIDAKFANLQSGLSQIGLDRDAMLSQRKEIDEFLTQEEERGAKLKEVAQASAAEAKSYQEVAGLRKSLMSSVSKSMEDKVRLAKIEEKFSEDVQILQLQVSTSRASLQELSTRKSSIQQDISSSKQRIFFLDKRAPELEAEKKVAAAARNFKEAARIAAEAKSLTVEKDAIQNDMKRAVLELEKLEEEIKDTVSKLQEYEGLISSKEREVARARFERLLLVAGSAAAEREAALQFGDQDEANLLHVEAEAADAEAKEMQLLHNFKVEEFVNLPKHFISMELVANLGRKQLAELAATINISPA